MFLTYLQLKKIQIKKGAIFSYTECPITLSSSHQTLERQSYRFSTLSKGNLKEILTKLGFFSFTNK